MKNRDYTKEILNKKKYLTSNIDGFNRVYERLDNISLLENFYEDALIHGFSDNEVVATELEVFDGGFSEGIKYIPVSLVACIESFFRFLFAHTIDSAPLYRTNAAKFDIKFSIKTAIDLEVNQLTIGEFISHLLKVNNLDDIGSNMKQILGEDFFYGFKQWRVKLDKQPELFPISDDEKNAHIFNNLSRLFELRHCICHEAYTPLCDDDYRQLVSFSPYVREFLYVTERFVEDHVSSHRSA
ncbi:HEPN domain-containing protein [Vibrio algarum]|uniref:HEPN domain-containing protein n=1 Tax=Vibrio algarum TaxID=3020714 RepID=A0ABT4YL33_9VIBR|nr:HEPN domain-containing protein [Vibrio sp. KJ40-1]MDB1122240.1 HEPN domain-containing protein [Vibrio sp. KJ40-1]